LVRCAGGDILEGMPPGQVKAARSMLQDLRVAIVTNAMVRHCTKLPHVILTSGMLTTLGADSTCATAQFDAVPSPIRICSRHSAYLTTATLLSAMLAESLTLCSMFTNQNVSKRRDPMVMQATSACRTHAVSFGTGPFRRP